VPKRGTACAPEAKIVVSEGPYIVSGGIALASEKYALCRCGASANKPFCDGTHVDVTFDDGLR
jgi:CDGSH-type Zn-finger protein